MIGKNNPFNIRVGNSKWLMMTGSTRGFVDFADLDYGIRAAAILIMRSYRMHNVCTIAEIINRFAPPSENSTSDYIDYLCSSLSCFPFDIPIRSQFPFLLHYMSKYEGNPVPLTQIDRVIDKFNIVPYKCK